LGFGAEHPDIIIGSNHFIKAKCILEIKGRPVISIGRSQYKERPFSLNMDLRDRDGNKSLEIQNNEFIHYNSNCDLKAEGRFIEIRSKPYCVNIRLALYPPRELVVEKLTMLYNHVRIDATEKWIQIDIPNVLPNARLSRNLFIETENCIRL
jgi:hypothetical protein